ncbi:MAG: sulfurtransferase [Blastocatellia bacterium]|nr:sulfurtransferase [Blastocatellia bacterium]MCS7157470.1 sulfurtransferase [Blastocatellia bacterium]MDW8168374.1 sulfurtransferase [Acidobacteriota bacterium]MDW8255570.1 sulfurtransferase [Acidobacteriota bacterium]
MKRRKIRFSDGRRALSLGLGVLLLLATIRTSAFALDEGYAHPEMLVETEWLAQHLNDPDIRIVDLRSAEAYAEGHIPNAVHLDQSALRDTEDRLLYVPSPERFAALMSELGISHRTRVIAYDEIGGQAAARLWFLLDYYGHTNVSLLNGGWRKWVKEGRPVSRDVPRFEKVEFHVRTKSSTMCTAPELVSKLRADAVVIIDARSPEEYRGERASGARGGHIPGALNVEWRLNLTEGEVPVFKSAAELRRLYESLGVTKDKEIITYCQGGGRAAHTLFVLRLLGYTKSRSYYGSWQDWSTRPELPVERPKSPDSR